MRYQSDGCESTEHVADVSVLLMLLRGQYAGEIRLSSYLSAVLSGSQPAWVPTASCAALCEVPLLLKVLSRLQNSRISVRLCRRGVKKTISVIC